MERRRRRIQGSVLTVQIIAQQNHVRNGNYIDLWRYINNSKYCEYAIYINEGLRNREQLALFPMLAVTIGPFHNLFTIACIDDPAAKNSPPSVFIWCQLSQELFLFFCLFLHIL